jgi:ankyrin repeat protein
MLLNTPRVKVNLQDKEGFSALHLASSQHDSPELISTLLKAGASRQLQSNYGSKPVDLAFTAGHKLTQDCLLKVPDRP